MKDEISEFIEAGFDDIAATMFIGFGNQVEAGVFVGKTGKAWTLANRSIRTPAYHQNLNWRAWKGLPAIPVVKPAVKRDKIRAEFMDYPGAVVVNRDSGQLVAVVNRNISPVVPNNWSGLKHHLFM